MKQVLRTAQANNCKQIVNKQASKQANNCKQASKTSKQSSKQANNCKQANKQATANEQKEAK